MCVCVCVCERERVSVCVCVCVCAGQYLTYLLDLFMTNEIDFSSGNQRGFIFVFLIFKNLFLIFFLKTALAPIVTYPPKDV